MNQDVKIKTRVVRETDDAILVFIYALNRPEWIPLSQVERIQRDREGEGFLVISNWIAGKLGLKDE